MDHVNANGYATLKTGNQMSSEFFNTIELTGRQLAEAKVRAGTQNEKVLRYFMGKAGVPLGPSDVWRELFNEKIPLTSVRRAMTVLADKGNLEKLPLQGQGAFGAPEHKWRLAPRWTGENQQVEMKLCQ